MQLPHNPQYPIMQTHTPHQGVCLDADMLKICCLAHQTFTTAKQTNFTWVEIRTKHTSTHWQSQCPSPPLQVSSFPSNPLSHPRSQALLGLASSARPRFTSVCCTRCCVHMVELIQVFYMQHCSSTISCARGHNIRLFQRQTSLMPAASNHLLSQRHATAP